MTFPRSQAPKYYLPVFIIWIAVCNIAAIILAILWSGIYPNSFFIDPTVAMYIIVAINVLSLLLLIPMFRMDPIRGFLKSAIIWFVVVTIVYLAIGAFIALIPGLVQVAGDLWYHWKFKKIEEDL